MSDDKALKFAQDYMTDDDWPSKWEEFEWFADLEFKMPAGDVENPVELLTQGILALDARSAWTRVEDGLPEPDLDVKILIGTIEHQAFLKYSPMLEPEVWFVHTAVTIADDRMYVNIALCDVSHWMPSTPLPPPPEGE